MTALSAFNFSNLSFCASSIAPSMTFALPLPFALVWLSSPSVSPWWFSAMVLWIVTWTLVLLP
jgi:hypothetical protein